MGTQMQRCFSSAQQSSSRLCCRRTCCVSTSSGGRGNGKSAYSLCISKQFLFIVMHGDWCLPEQCGCCWLCCTGLRLQADFQQIDTLGTQHYDAPRQFDVATCMFAIHYFFDQQDTIKTLMETIAANLKPGVQCRAGMLCWQCSSICCMGIGVTRATGASTRKRYVWGCLDKDAVAYTLQAAACAPRGRLLRRCTSGAWPERMQAGCAWILCFRWLFHWLCA